MIVLRKRTQVASKAHNVAASVAQYPIMCSSKSSGNPASDIRSIVLSVATLIRFDGDDERVSIMDRSLRDIRESELVM